MENEILEIFMKFIIGWQMTVIIVKCVFFNVIHVARIVCHSPPKEVCQAKIGCFFLRPPMTSQVEFIRRCTSTQNRMLYAILVVVVC